jgi:DNA-binding CsgD family transcriptional regulator
VEILHSAGDQLELARTLADLGAVYHDLGESGKARTIERRALHLKQLCLAETVPAALAATASVADPAAAAPAGSGPSAAPAGVSAPSRTRPPLPSGASEEPDLNPDLSDAERRVATMAARGMTNRQISAKLYITVSTVEQHLTRIYRKLGVSRRSDLPTWIEPDLVRGR